MIPVMGRASSAGWLVSGVLALAAARASAAEIDWHAPDPCPDAAELRFLIERAIGMPLSHAAALHFEVRAERSPQGYAARMDVATGPDEVPRRRVLVAPDCSRLADLVSVTAAIALGAKEEASDAEAEPELARSEVAGSAIPADAGIEPPTGGPRDDGTSGLRARPCERRGRRSFHCGSSPMPGHCRVSARVWRSALASSTNLKRITSPAAYRNIQFVSIFRNAGLTDIDFGRLERSDYLLIRENAALANVVAPSLATVDTLQVVDNPQLLPTVFDGVQTFDRRISGNADAVAP